MHRYGMLEPLPHSVRRPPSHGRPQEAELAGKALRSMQATLLLAQEVGKGVGRGEVLFGPMPPKQQAAAPGTIVCSRATRLSRGVAREANGFGHSDSRLRLRFTSFFRSTRSTRPLGSAAFTCHCHVVHQIGIGAACCLGALSGLCLLRRGKRSRARATLGVGSFPWRRRLACAFLRCTARGSALTGCSSAGDRLVYRFLRRCCFLCRRFPGRSLLDCLLAGRLAGTGRGCRLARRCVTGARFLGRGPCCRRFPRWRRSGCLLCDRLLSRGLLRGALVRGTGMGGGRRGRACSFSCRGLRARRLFQTLVLPCRPALAGIAAPEQPGNVTGRWRATVGPALASLVHAVAREVRMHAPDGLRGKRFPCRKIARTRNADCGATTPMLLAQPQSACRRVGNCLGRCCRRRLLCRFACHTFLLSYRVAVVFACAVLLHVKKPATRTA